MSQVVVPELYVGLIVIPLDDLKSTTRLCWWFAHQMVARLSTIISAPARNDQRAGEWYQPVNG